VFCKRSKGDPGKRKINIGPGRILFRRPVSSDKPIVADYEETIQHYVPVYPIDVAQLLLGTSASTIAGGDHALKLMFVIIAPCLIDAMIGLMGIDIP
jgi:hypothetical protein